jgi:hypothetical protein
MSTDIIVRKTQVSSAPSLARRVSWGAIFAGLFVTIVIQLLFTFLGLAIGLVSIDPLRDQSATHHLAIGAGIWLLVTGLISIWIGSCVAGRLCGGPLQSDGLIHGIVTWSVSTCVTMFLLATTAGALLGGTGALWSGALAIGGTVAGQDTTTAALQDSLPTIFPQATGTRLSPTGRTDNSPSAQPAQADQQNQNQPVEKPARGVSQGALWACIALFLGLLAAASGGWMGTASLPVDEITPESVRA